ncbi:GGDEF domain-containing protein [Curvibacter gracilis]|uniref:GGDEF domain-containing protein n=1 Tax=Curvibacter gracilis TaxID=230310 RepID=UPI000687E25F|nr:GGDEF domain-containing protein [Curvibacter gracilis]
MLSLPFDWPALRFKLRQWAREHDQVAPQAGEINLARMRILTPLLGGLSALSTLVFAFRLLLLESSGASRDWLFGLLWAHLAMGLLMLVFMGLTHHLRHDARRLAGRLLPLAWLVIELVYATVLACIDQWVTPNITPFVLGCMLAGLLLHLRPRESALLFALAAGGFMAGIGLTQAQPENLLSNRVNGVCACLLGLTLSVLLWRKFAVITLQQRALEKANQALQTKQRELERLTRVDGLTALLNRSTFVELTRNELARARRQGTPTTLLLLDLDHFKQVNDTWGHPAGDEVLRHVAALCSGTVRSTDLVGRLGGEEFIILLPATRPEAGRVLAEKLRLRIQNTPAHVQGRPLGICMSIGLASTAPDAEASFDTLYAAADQALYQAKQWGRNRVV